MKESPEGFDLAALLAPISQEAPAGTDLRQDSSPDSLYYRLRDARREAGAAERAEATRGEEEPRPLEDTSSVPLFLRWRSIRELAVEALSLHSKDLEIGAWLTEALLRSDGLVGLTAGTRLMAGLAEDFWDELFPQPDEEGFATRLAPLSGLNGVGREGTLLEPLRKVVLFQRPGDKSSFQFWRYEQSIDVAGSGDAERRQSFYDTGRVVPFETIEKEADHVGSAHFAQLHEKAAEAVAAWQTLSQVLDQRAGADAPPMSRVRDLLERIQEVAKRFATSGTGMLEMDTAPPGEEAATADLTAPLSSPRVRWPYFA